MEPLAAKLVGLVITSAVLVGWLTWRVPDRHRALAWRRAHALPATDRHDALVNWWVQTFATMRVVGGVGGIAVGTLFDEAFGVRTSAGFGFWAWVCAGWVLGGTFAYLSISGAALTREGAASIVPRRPADYLPRAARYGPAMATGVAVLLALVADAPHPGATAAVAVVLLGASTLAMRQVIGRAQPADDPSLVAVDDAMRSATCHLLGAGATATILLVAVHGVIVPTTAQPGDRSSSLLWWTGAAATATAFWFSRYLVDRPWFVRRNVDAGTAP
jgi:hypothetical protein